MSKHKPPTTVGPDAKPATSLAPQCDRIRDALTPKQAAEIIGVRPETIRGWCCCGELQPVYNIGSAAAPRYRIPREALLAKCEIVRPLIIN